MYSQSLNYGAGHRMLGRQQQQQQQQQQRHQLHNHSRAVPSLNITVSSGIGLVGINGGFVNNGPFKYGSGLGIGSKPNSEPMIQIPLAPITFDAGLNNNNGNSDVNSNGAYNRPPPQCRPGGPFQFVPANNSNGFCQFVTPSNNAHGNAVNNAVNNGGQNFINNGSSSNIINNNSGNINNNNNIGKPPPPQSMPSERPPIVERPRGGSCGSWSSWASRGSGVHHQVSHSSVVSSSSSASQAGSLLVGVTMMMKPAATNDNKKKKTELCRHYVRTGKCPYMEKCHFAHGEEDRVSFCNVEEMQKAGVIVDANNYMCRPCNIFVSTGCCPYITRCKFLHDPNIKGDENSYPSWLEHCTKYKKKEPDIIPDRLYHHRINGIHQENPIIDPFIWSGSRPSSRTNDRAANNNGNAKNSIGKDVTKLEWQDTYDLVCNLGVQVFAPSRDHGGRSSFASASSSSNYAYANKNVNASANKKLSELQKLCIVLSMHRECPIDVPVGKPKCEGPFFDHHLDFTYSPTHCLNGQPCMILQTRYFRLLDPKPVMGNSTPSHRWPSPLSIKDIVKEVSPDEYHAWRSISPNAMVSTHEVVFDSKGKRSANLSIWFDVDITICSNNKAKKLSKKGEDHWQMDDRTGALFCMPKNETFELTLPAIEPHVSMQPIEDFPDGLALVESILEHRIGTILLSQGLRFDKFQFGKAELVNRLVELEKIFLRMKDQVQRWFWPKTSNMDHICKTAEERNQTEYCPEVSSNSSSSISQANSVIPDIWNSFVVNLNSNEDYYGPVTISSQEEGQRLPVFRSIMQRRSTKKNLPHIRSKNARQVTVTPPSPSSSLSDATWKELLLGEYGAWKIAIESHEAKSELIRQTAILNTMTIAQ